MDVYKMLAFICFSAAFLGVAKLLYDRMDYSVDPFCGKLRIKESRIKSILIAVALVFFSAWLFVFALSSFVKIFN